MHILSGLFIDSFTFLHLNIPYRCPTLNADVTKPRLKILLVLLMSVRRCLEGEQTDTLTPCLPARLRREAAQQ